MADRFERREDESSSPGPSKPSLTPLVAVSVIEAGKRPRNGFHHMPLIPLLTCQRSNCVWDGDETGLLRTTNGFGN